MSNLRTDKLDFDGRERARELEQCDHEKLAWHAAILEHVLAQSGRERADARAVALSVGQDPLPKMDDPSPGSRGGAEDMRTLLHHIWRTTEDD